MGSNVNFCLCHCPSFPIVGIFIHRFCACFHHNRTMSCIQRIKKKTQFLVHLLTDLSMRLPSDFFFFPLKTFHCFIDAISRSFALIKNIECDRIGEFIPHNYTSKENAKLHRMHLISCCCCSSFTWAQNKNSPIKKVASLSYLPTMENSMYCTLYSPVV